MDNVAEVKKTGTVVAPILATIQTTVDTTAENVQRDVTQEKIDENCPKCGKQLSIRLGRRGRLPAALASRNVTTPAAWMGKKKTSRK